MGAAEVSKKHMLPRSSFRALLCVGAAVWISLLSGCAGGSSLPPGTGSKGVQVFPTNDVVRVEIDGQLFTEYHYRNVSRPYFYPLLSVDGDHYTRRWPQENVPGEERDHPHHHSLWYSHGDVNGVDLWSESDKAGRTVQQSIIGMKSGKAQGSLITRNEWRARDGTLLAHDERTHHFSRGPGSERILDFTITILATQGDLTLGDTKEGTFAIRIAESMRNRQPKNQPGEGHLLSSRGHKDGDVWGKRAEWVDYWGPVNGKILGLAIFDHPANPRHPTWWHARDYGLFAANPFGVHDFEKRPKGSGDLRIPSGGSVTFRYRVLFHAGDSGLANIVSRYEEYVRTVKDKP
jgi:hypothetical protein